MERETLKLALEAYLCREMPAGTIIGDPKWWVPKIAAAIKEALAQPAQEPVAWEETDEVECPVCKDKGFPWPKCGHITYLERTPPKRERVVFPTMLRKMWSGGEVQAWLDENVNKEKNNG